MKSEIAIPMEVESDLAEPGLLSDLVNLTKARLSLLVIITTFVGFLLASSGSVDWLHLLNATLGTALAAAGAGALNQWMEVRVDRLMERTRHRPLPAGRMRPSTALFLGILFAVGGTAWLAWTCNAMSAYLSAATVVIYIAFYTPLKRKTSLCTIVGAVSGAIPPMIGWAAARPSLDLGAWVLFGILFTWQMPHFLAIAWMYRDEYAQAGFVMLRRDDVTGSSTAVESLLFTAALVGITFIPFWSGMLSEGYLAWALLLDAAIFGCALRFLVERSRNAARALFFASIIFLPLILGLMVITKA
ncbi:MAG TPA: heme o synthase [Chthoniobacteraceae bacterium]|nr:heme o synthase [Chthoniobacteraceae bacterium]